MSALAGHITTIDLLRRTVEQDRPAHAYLFTGREGTGKKKVAVRFACMLNCLSPECNAEGTCSACRRICSGTHPDVVVEEADKGIIRIERVRQIQHFFRYPPVEGRYRVTVIDNAHLMNRSAQNALLKILEEPPERRILVLVTARPYLLLSTVRSRCRRIRFAPLTPDTVARLLRDIRKMDPSRAEALAAMSGGSVSTALSMDRSNLPALRERLISALMDPGVIGLVGLMELSAAISSDRRTALEVIQAAITWIRDLLVTKVGAASTCALANRDYLDTIASAAHRQGVEQLISVFDELVNAARLIEWEINVNPNLVTDLLLLRIIRTIAGPTLGVRSDAA